MTTMRFYSFYWLFIVALFFSCKEKRTTPIIKTDPVETETILYAKGFEIESFDTYRLLKVTKAFPEATKTFTYALVSQKKLQTQIGSEENNTLIELLNRKEIDAIIQVPITSIVVTSTTHIPSLEMLGVPETLVGFPNLDYISSPLSRKRISQNHIKELGQNESINTEMTIDLNPDIVVGYGIEGENKAFESVQRAGIPVLYNGDWVERNPLGKAEWIKFFGALYGKSKEANRIFKNIERDYLKAKEIAKSIEKKPTVLAGALYKDIWYIPNGDSWQAQIIRDAGGDYLWANTEGTGSIALSIESVLDKAQNANIWIAPGRFTTYTGLKESNHVYQQFAAFEQKKTYTFASKKGETGGMLYYELAPNRPDLVLKDLIFYLHPELLSEYTPYFFTPLND